VRLRNPVALRRLTLFKGDPCKKVSTDGIPGSKGFDGRDEEKLLPRMIQRALRRERALIDQRP